MSDVFGIGDAVSAAGSIAAAAIAADAQKDAVKMQIDALKQQRDFVFNELDPQKISGFSSAQDVQRAKDRLALQSVTDPDLLATRYAAQAKLREQVLGIGSTAGDKLGAQAAAEFGAESENMAELKNRLIDAALGELEAGATLPGDVQAELVRAGLEQGGMVQGSANPRGFAGTAARKLIGERGLALQAERQTRAAQLGTAAQNLSTSRANILATLFPSLKQAEAQNQALATSAFNVSDASLPDVGLTGTNIANLWAARVGATNQMALQAADAAARGAQAQGQIWGNAVGNATRALAPTINDIFKPTPSPYSGTTY